MQAAIIIVVAVIIGLSAFIITKKPDTFVEQAAEAVIDDELGLPPGTIDLTPNKLPNSKK